MKRTLPLLALVAGATFVGIHPASAAEPVGSDANQASAWEAYLSEQGQTATCYKHGVDEQTPHGYVTEDGKSVILGTYQEDWPGDHYALLVVKGGNANAVYADPASGVTYAAPLNRGGNVADVSHWIVCKGQTPEVTTTTAAPTTTVPTPPTTVPMDAVCPPVGTSTVCHFAEVPYDNPMPLPHATGPDVVTAPPVEVEAAQVTVAPAPAAEVPTLAYTGSDTVLRAAVGFAALALGAALALYARRHKVA